MSDDDDFAGVRRMNYHARRRRMTDYMEDGKLQRNDARQRRKRRDCRELAGGFGSRRLEVARTGPNGSNSGT